MGVASFIVQYRITKLLKSTLFVKLPAIRFHILTSFLVGKLVVLPPFSRGNTAFFKNAEDFLKFLQKFFERTKCARPKSPDGRIGIVSSIQMIRQFIYISVVSPGGGRAFFDKSITVGFCRYAFCFMAATSFSRRFQQWYRVISLEDKKKRRLWFFKAAAEIKERQATVLILLQYGYWGHKLNQKRADNSSISNCILSALRLCVWLF